MDIVYSSSFSRVSSFFFLNPELYFFFFFYYPFGTLDKESIDIGSLLGRDLAVGIVGEELEFPAEGVDRDSEFSCTLLEKGSCES